MGHSYMWAANAKQHGYPTGGTIQLGDVMSFERGVLGASGEYGHVAIVEEIHEDGSILISESGGGQRRAVPVSHGNSAGRWRHQRCPPPGGKRWYREDGGRRQLLKQRR